MSRNLANLFIFALGAVAGSLATFKYAEKKYAARASEEIESVKEAFRNSGGSLLRYDEDKSKDSDGRKSTVDEKTTDIQEKVKRAGERFIQEQEKEMSNYEKLVKKNEYINREPDEPRVISPDEFGEEEDYTQISLTLYADGVLVDDNNDEMGENEINRTIGPYALDHLGDYEDDCVHVCNDRLEAYYEVLTDTRKWSDILEDRPYLRK